MLKLADILPSGDDALKARIERLRSRGYTAPGQAERIAEQRYRCYECLDRKTVMVDLPPGPDGFSRSRSTECPACAPSIEEKLAKRGIPAEQCRASLTIDVHPQNAEIAASLDALVNARFELGGTVRSLYLSGGYGTGKTWIAAGVCRAVLERLKWSIEWVTVRDLLRELQAIYQSQRRDRDDDGGQSEWEILRRYQSARLVVLNELPRTRVTPWVAEQIEGIVDFRINARKPTILTGNMDADEIADLYNGALASRLGPRFFDRIPFTGEDLRALDPS